MKPSPEETALLAQLRDIHLPEESTWTAVLPAPTFMGGVLLIAVVLLALYRWWRHPRQVALRKLQALEQSHAQNGDTISLAQGINQLLRREAMRRFPDSPVAGLVGAEWLAFLGIPEETGLATLPYRACGSVDTAMLIAQARRWLKEPS